MKRIYWILTSISLYSLLSCSNGAKDTREYQTVKTDTVVSAGGQTSLQYPGKVKAAQDISLAFRVSGTIQKIYVKDGARVQAGQQGGFPHAGNHRLRQAAGPPAGDCDRPRDAGRKAGGGVRHPEGEERAGGKPLQFRPGVSGVRLFDDDAG